MSEEQHHDPAPAAEQPAPAEQPASAAGDPAERAAPERHAAEQPPAECRAPAACGRAAAALPASDAAATPPAPPASASPASAPPASARQRTQGPPLDCLCYEGPAPAPLPAVTDPTPEEVYQHHSDEQRARAAALQEDGRRAPAEATGTLAKLGAFGKAALSYTSSAASTVHGGIEAKAREQIHHRQQQVFTAAFPELATARVHCAYGCKAMHRGIELPGEVFVCDTHVCFIGKNDVVRDAVPLTEVASVQPSIVLPTSRDVTTAVEDGPPYILPVPARQVIPSAVQVFTRRDRRVLQYLRFDNTGIQTSRLLTSSLSGPSTAVLRFYNFLDHAWRAATAVPLPGVGYIPE